MTATSLWLHKYKKCVIMGFISIRCQSIWKDHLFALYARFARFVSLCWWKCCSHKSLDPFNNSLRASLNVNRSQSGSFLAESLMGAETPVQPVRSQEALSNVYIQPVLNMGRVVCVNGCHDEAATTQRSPLVSSAGLNVWKTIRRIPDSTCHTLRGEFLSM